MIVCPMSHRSNLMDVSIVNSRSSLDKIFTQIQYGWIYLKYDFKRVPYWASVAQLELLFLILVQV